jgi:hypothetical protein
MLHDIWIVPVAPKSPVGANNFTATFRETFQGLVNSVLGSRDISHFSPVRWLTNLWFWDVTYILPWIIRREPVKEPEVRIVGVRGQ